MMNQNQRIEYVFNLAMFMSDIRLKTGKQSLRDIEAVVGISASTLSRMDNGHEPDMPSFLQICSRCQLTPGNYFDQEVWERKK